MNYSVIRSSLFKGKLLPSQFAGIQAILNACQVEQVADQSHIAYILATAYHETAKTMQPIEEFGRGAKYDYGKKLDMGGGPGKRVPYTEPNHLYYGRGHVQLTWRCNYVKMGKLLGVDLLNHPELALSLDISAKILVKGMKLGCFTGAKLTLNLNFTQARRIINGTDKAELIAGYAEKFLTALS